MALVPVAEAAERLGVSTRQVQHLVASGDLRMVARGVLDAASLERLLAVRGGSHRRAWSEFTAWGAVAMLSALDPEWMGVRQRARLRSRLLVITPTELVERARNRASVTRYRAHPSAARHLRAELVLVGDDGALGLADSSRIDGYVVPTEVSRLVSRHGLVRDDEGSVTLRSTSFDRVRAVATSGVALTALDLAESLDVRERRAGTDALDRALEALRG